MLRVLQKMSNVKQQKNQLSYIHTNERVQVCMHYFKTLLQEGGISDPIVYTCTYLYFEVYLYIYIYLDTRVPLSKFAPKRGSVQFLYVVMVSKGLLSARKNMEQRGRGVVNTYILVV